MYESIIIAGFGGQGILFAGQLLAYASMESGGEASWLPSYGPEMRGGTANVMVVVSSDRIRSPYIVTADSVIAMNKPSLEKFEPRLRKNGTLVVNSDMTVTDPTREDITWFGIGANTMSTDIGSPRVANMVVLGAYLALRPILPLDVVIASLDHVVAASRRELLELNANALRAGYALVEREAVK